MKRYEARVHEVVLETADTVTLWLDVGERAEYRAGQFLTIDPHQIPQTQELARALEESKGKKERARAYSLGSAPHERHLALTVKEEGPGEFPSLLSPWLVHQVRAGDRFPISGFSGMYTLPDDIPAGAHLVHLCSGSGIVPNFGIIKDVLHRRLPLRQTLLYSSRTWADVIYRDALTELARQAEGRLRVVHALTRDAAAPPGVTVRTRRIDAEMIREVAGDSPDAWFFVCGSSITAHERAAARSRGETPAPRFMETQRTTLLDLGVDRRRLHTEGW